MAHTFDLAQGGVAWVDSGWTDPLASSHVCHYLEGSVMRAGSGWLLSTREGDRVVVETNVRVLPLEGDRDMARRGIQRDFYNIWLCDS